MILNLVLELYNNNTLHVIHLHLNCHLIHEKISLMKELKRKRVTLQDRASHELITNKKYFNANICKRHVLLL